MEDDLLSSAAESSRHLYYAISQVSSISPVGNRCKLIITGLKVADVHSAFRP